MKEYNVNQQIYKEIYLKNIRATALDEFWGTEYSDSLYLWEGAKHQLTLNEMEKIKEDTLEDLFDTPEKITIASEYCQEVYYKILPKLAVRLNEIFEINLPDTFWRTAFGYWLFRHICIAYEKYVYLSKIDIDRTSIKLLDKESFYIPYDHYEYVYCFCNDFGVQQLVSHYYYLFKIGTFPSIPMTFEIPRLKENQNTVSECFTLRKRLSNYGKSLVRLTSDATKFLFRSNLHDVEPRIVLCGVWYTAEVALALFDGSNGMIGPLHPPTVIKNYAVNTESRQELCSIKSENDFEYFLVQTFYYCLPQMFLEQFRDYYDAFLKDIRSKKFTHIVSEYWISDILSSIYIAIAQNEGRKLICYEHGSGTVFDSTSLNWIELLVADRYMTVGWKTNHKKIIQGGFISRDIKSYQFQSGKTNILYIARTNFPYLMEFTIYNVPNTKSIRELKRIRDFYDLLPEYHRDCFVLRPRKEDHLWNTEHTLEVKKKNIRVDNGNYLNFSDSISNARIVIIDHLSTGIAEILLMKVPCLIMHHEEDKPLIEEIHEIFYELKRCGVMHNSVQSAVSHLTAIYDDVEQWWTSEPVQTAINKLISATLAPPSKTINYLMTCLKEKAA